MDSSIIYRFFFIFLIFISPVKAIEFQGKFLQGHFILGKTDPNAKILVGKKEIKATEDFWWDRVHTTPKGSKAIADAIFPKLINFLN